MSSANRKIIDQVGNRFQERFPGRAYRVARAPGRVNLLGEHVDYHEGFVIPAAIDKAAWIAFAPSADGISHILAADFDAEISLTGESIKTRSQANAAPLPEWGLYPAGVMQALISHGYEPPAIDAVLTSDVPRGAGLSSSAAVEMAFLTAWLNLGEWEIAPLTGALLCREAENRYVGVNCGIMDQFASACGVEGALLFLDCRSLEWEAYRLPDEVVIVIADTMVRRKLSLESYNQRRSDCDAATRLLRQQIPEIKTLRDVKPEDFYHHAGHLPPRIAKRACHVVEEIERTRQARKFLETGDAANFGRLMNACHVSLRDLFEVSNVELDTMVSIAQSIDGCLGARLTGAGFGGCAVCLVESVKAGRFVSILARKYDEIIGKEPEISIAHLVNGASLVEK